MALDFTKKGCGGFRMKHCVVGIVSILVLASLQSAEGNHPFCPPQSTHTYGVGAGLGATTAATRSGAGFVSVQDTNLGDCNGDGLPADYDGDLDAGSGGGAFGYGPFAASCGHHVHGGNFLVVDLVAANLAFVVGADDQTGGIPDPVTGAPTCITDGVISPGTDADDCLTGVQFNFGSVGACTGGGDGLVWVFFTIIDCEWTLWPPGIECDWSRDLSFADPPTVGTITSF